MVSSDRNVHLDHHVCIPSNEVMRVFNRSVFYSNN